MQFTLLKDTLLKLKKEIIKCREISRKTRREVGFAAYTFIDSVKPNIHINNYIIGSEYTFPLYYPMLGAPKNKHKKGQGFYIPTDAHYFIHFHSHAGDELLPSPQDIASFWQAASENYRMAVKGQYINPISLIVNNRKNQILCFQYEPKLLALSEDDFYKLINRAIGRKFRKTYHRNMPFLDEYDGIWAMADWSKFLIRNFDSFFQFINRIGIKTEIQNIADMDLSRFEILSEVLDIPLI